MASCKIPIGVITTLRGYNDKGCPVRQPLSEIIATPDSETVLTVTDSSSINLTAGATGNGHTGLTAEVNLSAQVGNILIKNADGLYVPTPAAVTETSLIADDSDTINFTVSGISNHRITGDVKISATAGNILTKNGDGLYATIPAVGGVEATTVSDTSSLDLILTGTNITGNVKVSSEVGNTLTVEPDGLYAGCEFNITSGDAANNVLTSETISCGDSIHFWSVNDLGIVVTPGSARVGFEINLSTDAGNQLQRGSDGKLFVPASTTTGESTTVTDTATLDLTLTGSAIKGDVKISGTAGNVLTTNADGLYVPTPTAVSETSLSASSGQTIAFNLSGVANHTIAAEVKVSATFGNAVTINTDGIYVPTAALSETALTVTDSNSINLITSGVNGHELTAEVKISVSANNALTLNPDGLYVPAALASHDPVTVLDSNTIDLTLSTQQIKADVILDPDVCNNLTSSSSGLAQILREGVVRVCNKPGWEDVIRNAAQDSRIEFDAGVYMRSDTALINLKKGQEIWGKGGQATKIVSLAGTTGLFKITSPVNSSTRVNIKLIDFGMEGVNSGAAVEDNCGTFITVRGCHIHHWQYGIILDQSEVVFVDDNIIESCLLNCIWLTNGADRTAGALVEFTNQIKITNNHLSGGDALTQQLVRDDGGYAHSYLGNNWNGGVTQLWLTSGKGYIISGANEMEGAVDRPIRLDYLKPDGSGASGGCFGGVISGNIIVDHDNVNGVISFNSGKGLSVHGNFFQGNPVTNHIMNVFSGDGVANLSQFSNEYNTDTFYNRDPNNSWEFNPTTGLYITPDAANPTNPALQIRENLVVRKTIRNDGTII